MPVPTPDPHRRNEHSRVAILEAALDLAADVGYEALSIEAIAKRAGVGKQTIYRWWPSKGAVVLEALSGSLVGVVHFTDTGDLVADFRTELAAVNKLFNSRRVGKVYRGFLVAVQADPLLSQTFRDQVVDPATEACRRRLATARDRGEIRTDFDDYTLVDLIYGTVLRRSLLSLRPLDQDFIDAALTIVFDGIRSKEPATSTKRTRRSS